MTHSSETLSATASSSPPSLPCAQPRLSLLTPAEVEDSQLPGSQMSEFLSDGSPLRTRPRSPPPQSRQSSLSLYASCQGSPRKDATECTLLQDSEEIEVSQKDEDMEVSQKEGDT